MTDRRLLERAACALMLTVLPLVTATPARADRAPGPDSTRVAGAATPAPTSFDRPFYSGVFLGDKESRTERIDDALSDFTRLVGKRPALVKTFRTLGSDMGPSGWSGQLMRKVDRAGSTNFVALDLRYAGAPGDNLLDAINAGRADALIRANARQIKALGFTVLLSPGWEMNGRWNDYAWQGHANGGEHGGPAKYAAAFRRMVDLFRAEGAHNVKWVFSPNVGNAFTHRGTGEAHWNWYGHYYPGDKYVDYLGPHGYNGSSLWGGRYQEFETMFNGDGADHTLSDMERRFPGKQIIISEYASEELRGQDKGAWIQRAYETMRRHSSIVGAIWFQMDKETDWRVNSSATSLRAYRAALADPQVRTSWGR